MSCQYKCDLCGKVEVPKPEQGYARLEVMPTTIARSHTCLTFEIDTCTECFNELKQSIFARMKS